MKTDIAARIILEQCTWITEIHEGDTAMVEMDDVIEAMQEYAQYQAIEFAKWVHNGIR